jgi:hypothetical protein
MVYLLPFINRLCSSLPIHVAKQSDQLKIYMLLSCYDIISLFFSLHTTLLPCIICKIVSTLYLSASILYFITLTCYSINATLYVVFYWKTHIKNSSGIYLFLEEWLIPLYYVSWFLFEISCMFFFYTFHTTPHIKLH